MKTLLLLVAGMLVVAADCQKAFGQEEELQKKPMKNSADVAAVSNLALGLDLAVYGRKHKSPTVLLAAAEIIGKQAKRPLKGEKAFAGTNPDEGAEGAEGAEDSVQKKAKPDFTHEKLIQEARDLSKSDKALTELADRLDDELSESKRGLVGGPRWVYTTCPLRGFYRWNGVYFNAGRVVAIKLRGDGSSDLDIRIFDGRGNLVASDTSYGDLCSIVFVPRFAGPYSVLVTNTGYSGNDFYVACN